MKRFSHKQATEAGNREPSEDDIRDYCKKHGLKYDDNFYIVRERLRELAYGGRPPKGYQSWGDYWKMGI